MVTKSLPKGFIEDRKNFPIDSPSRCPCIKFLEPKSVMESSPLHLFDHLCAHHSARVGTDCSVWFITAWHVYQWNQDETSQKIEWTSSNALCSFSPLARLECCGTLYHKGFITFCCMICIGHSMQWLPCMAHRHVSAFFRTPGCVFLHGSHSQTDAQVGTLHGQTTFLPQESLHENVWP